MRASAFAVQLCWPSQLPSKKLVIIARRDSPLSSISFRHILPALPDEDFVMLSQEKANHTVEHHINSSSVLHPLILPRLYPPLFTLYALHTEKADAVYTERLHQLNKRGDVALMSFLGVNRYASIYYYPIVQFSSIC